MSEDIDDLYLSIQINKIPKLWNKYGYLSVKRLSSWYDDLILRLEFFRKWLENDKV